MSQTAATSDVAVDVAVIGGGAAGLMAAIWSARGGAGTVLLEGSKACGLKILISGGGRCNVLPSESDHRDFFTSGSRNVVKRLFRTWRLADVRAYFEQDLDIPLVLEEESGKLFPEGQQARPVRDRLVAEAEAAGAEVRTSWRVVSVSRSDSGFEIHGEDGGIVVARRVVLSTGGQSLPKTGSDGAGYGFARELGHSIVDPYPALVPLHSPDEGFRALTGISLPVRWRARVGGKVVEERERELLFTHHGFSGPAILDASHWVVRDGAELQVAWGAFDRETWLERWRRDARKQCRAMLVESLPKRLVDELVRRSRLAKEIRYDALTNAQCERLLANLCHCPLPIAGDGGYAKAEVTGGGVPIGEVNPSTLESRATPGLYLCGEILDVIGRIGGYNFLWAWVTGRLAGESAAVNR